MRRVCPYLAILACAGCGARGGTTRAKSDEITTDGPATIVEPDGTQITTEGPTTIKRRAAESVQPQDPVETATATIVGDDVAGSTGASQPTDQALAGLGFYPLAGLILMVGGVVVWVLRRKFPFLPKYLGPALVALGVVVAAFTVVLDRYAWVAVPFVVAALAIAGYLICRRLGLFQAALDGTIAGVQRFKEAHPSAKMALNAELSKEHKRRGKGVDDAVRERKKQL